VGVVTDLDPARRSVMIVPLAFDENSEEGKSIVTLIRAYDNDNDDEQQQQLADRSGTIRHVTARSLHQELIVENIEEVNSDGELFAPSSSIDSSHTDDSKGRHSEPRLTNNFDENSCMMALSGDKAVEMAKPSLKENRSASLVDMYWLGMVWPVVNDYPPKFLVVIEVGIVFFFRNGNHCLRSVIQLEYRLGIRLLGILFCPYGHLCWILVFNTVFSRNG
jgi:hypothetical protein